jgi:hypothetical protein
VVTTYEQLAEQLKQQAAGVYTSVLLDLPKALREDEDRVADIVKALKQ